MRHKHKWRKVGGTFDSNGKAIVQKKRCLICGKIKVLGANKDE